MLNVGDEVATNHIFAHFRHWVARKLWPQFRWRRGALDGRFECREWTLGVWANEEVSARPDYECPRVHYVFE